MSPILLKTWDEVNEKAISRFVEELKRQENFDDIFLKFIDLETVVRGILDITSWDMERFCDSHLHNPSKEFHISYFLCDLDESEDIIGVISFTNFKVPTEFINKSVSHDTIYWTGHVFCYIYTLDKNASFDTIAFLFNEGSEMILKQMNASSLSITNLVYVEGIRKGVDDFVGELIKDNARAIKWKSEDVSKVFDENLSIVSIRIRG